MDLANSRVVYKSSQAWRDLDGAQHVHSQTVIGVPKTHQSAPHSTTEFSVVEVVAESNRPPFGGTITEFGISTNPRAIQFLMDRGTVKIVGSAQ